MIKKVRRLEIRTRRLVTDSVTGAYHSSFKGRGMDFEEVREYAIGDDIRSIDWNVSAKMDHPYVKIYREERELTILLLIDLSASGIFGSVDQSKRERAAEIASVLAFSATRNNDKVGLLLYTDEVEHYIPPKKGRRHILRVIRDILFFEPRGRGTGHRKALDTLNRVQRRKAVIFLISDFLDPSTAQGTPDADTLRKLAVTNQRHDLISVVLSDPRENELPPVGLVTLEDAETGEMVEINTSHQPTRKRYAQLANQRRERLQSQMRKKGLDWIEASTDGPYLPAIRQLFARRASRH
ncbi:MAG: DUF58 domain-containing protein [Opitutales bacterium]